MHQSQTTDEIKVEAIPVFTDNYIWKIIAKNHKSVVLVDPGDAEACIKNLEENQQQLASILITHHHIDHTGGVEALVAYAKSKQWPINVYGPKAESTPCNTFSVDQSDKITIEALAMTFQVIDLPGHTLGHIAYLSENKLFSGDTLFSGGCGRLFEGTPAQMYHSLQKLAQLPKETLVYCTHEYTLANLDFALTVNAENKQLQQYQQQVEKLRATDKISLPTSIKQELAINPFLRCFDKTIRSNVATFYPSRTIVSQRFGVRHYERQCTPGYFIF